ncbi:MAG: hypothetical protein AB4042_21405 [Leptolyngbyaceae cyanobacterium]
METEIYFSRNNDEVMEVQNWANRKDCDGPMITRLLSPSERDRYFSLKQTLNMRDSEIWRLLHPPRSTPQTAPPTASPVSSPKPASPLSKRNRQGGQPLSPPSGRPNPPNHRPPGREAIPGKPNPEIKIGSCELSKRALLHIIRKACGRDIEPLQHLSLADLQALAANVVLPKDGVPILIMPELPQSA